MDSEFGDFWSDDPLERYDAHQRAKGRTPIGDPDFARERARDAPVKAEEASEAGAWSSARREEAIRAAMRGTDTNSAAWDRANDDNRRAIRRGGKEEEEA